MDPLILAVSSQSLTPSISNFVCGHWTSRRKFGICVYVNIFQHCYHGLVLRSTFTQYSWNYKKHVNWYAWGKSAGSFFWLISPSYVHASVIESESPWCGVEMKFKHKRIAKQENVCEARMKGASRNFRNHCLNIIIREIVDSNNIVSENEGLFHSHMIKEQQKLLIFVQKDLSKILFAFF